MTSHRRRPRVIPALLVHSTGLRKGRRFSDGPYVGDPVNAIRIFNDKEVDEIIVLDVLASVEGRGPRVERVRDWASESFMPMCYGGGVTSMSQMEALFQAGVEKVSINAAAGDESLIRQAVAAFGSQSVVVGMDVRRGWFGRRRVMARRGQVPASDDVVAWALRLQDQGVGEILLQSIDRDGTCEGYDLETIRAVTEAVEIPTIALGGAGTISHFAEALAAGASAVAAGSMFVFHGPHRAVLITYPGSQELSTLSKTYEDRANSGLKK